MPFREPFKPKWRSPLGDFTSQVDLGGSSLSKAPKSPIPDANPFRVGLESNPVPKPIPPAAASYYGDALKFAQNASGVAVNVASEEVKEKVTVAALGKTVATAVGVVAIPFAAADLFDFLAPGVKSWLTGGWKGSDGRASSRVGPLVPGALGQCDAQYDVRMRLTYSDGSSEFTTQRVNGTIKSFEYIDPPGSPSYGLYLIHGQAGSPSAFNYLPIYLAAPSTLQSYAIVTITKVNGTPDNCAPPTFGPDPVTASPRPSNSPYTPRKPSPPVGAKPPFLENLPSTQSLSDLFGSPDEKDAPSPTSSYPPSPRAGGQSKPAPTGLPSEYEYPVPPKNPTPPLEEVGTCDPCSLAIGKKLDELREKLNEKKEDNEETEEPTCETYSFEYSYGICDSNGFTLEPRTLQLSQKPTAQLRAEFDNMLALAAKGCGNDAVAAIPDWWQVRVGAERPQIVVAFRKADSRTYHQIAVPHPISSQKWTENLLGDYRKGPWSGILTLKDNSKFIINCETRAEAQRMVGRAKLLIRPDMQFSPSTEQFTERKGNAVGVATMRGRQAYYFPTGQKDAKPEWRAQFD